MSTTANWGTYLRLRDMGLGNKDSQWTLGHVASWARWGGDKQQRWAPVTATNEEEFADLLPLTTSVVLFGVNWGGQNVPPHLTVDDPPHWSNFHTPNHRPDGALRNSFSPVIGDHVPAPYMSDVFKLVPTVDASKLDETIKADLARGIDHVDRCADLLRRELATCQQASEVPLIIGAMGDAAYRWLTAGHKTDPRIAQAVREVLGKDAQSRVMAMPHYAFASATNDERASALRSLMERSARP